MSGVALPRRYRVGILALAAAATLAVAAPASAQDPGSDPRSVTIVGGDSHARACMQGVNSGDVSDRTLASCTRALRYPRLTRETEALIRLNRGVAYLRRRESASALEDFDAVIALDGRNAEGHLNRGAALVQLGQPGPAVTAITEALSLGVREPHKAYFNRAAAREAMRDLRGAYEDYNTALEIQPNWGPASAELARFARARREHLAGVLGETDEQAAPQ
jgi:tetratricopeptide (TPR) repeat protein